MCSMPHRRSASARSAGAASECRAPWLDSARNHHVEGDGASYARCLNLRPGPDRRQRFGICSATLESVRMTEVASETKQTMDAPQPTLPLPRGPAPQAPPQPERRSIEIKID